MLETTLANLSVPLGLTFAIQLLSNEPKLDKNKNTNKNKKTTNKKLKIKTQQNISNSTLRDLKQPFRRVLV